MKFGYCQRLRTIPARCPAQLAGACFATGLLLCLLGAFVMQACGRGTVALSGNPADYDTLKELSAEQIAQLDIAQLNLLCAQGLPGWESLNLSESLAVLDQWAARVRAETERHAYRFERNPAEFENSKGFFKLLMLGVVLAEDYRVHYRTDRQVSPEMAAMNDGFFADARDVFLSGLIGESRAGTCSSMPVLYVALGRRLGYPLKLVTTQGHLFLRWEGEGERFNLEVTGNGLNRFTDDYYRHWPFEVSEAEVAAEGYLKSLTSAEEQAVFLSIRAMCLREAGKMNEAAEAFELAAKLAPQVQSYRLMAVRCRGLAAGRSLEQNGKESL